MGNGHQGLALEGTAGKPDILVARGNISNITEIHRCARNLKSSGYGPTCRERGNEAYWLEVMNLVSLEDHCSNLSKALSDAELYRVYGTERQGTG